MNGLMWNGMNLLAQSGGGNGSGGVLVLLFGLIVFVVSLAIGIGILWLIFDALSAVPEPYRKMTPGLVFLMLIPLFNLVWVFFVVNRVPASFKLYFEGIGRPQPGDYGQAMGLTAAICMVVSIVPFIGFIAGLVFLVCIILFLVKITALKQQVRAGGGAARGFEVMPGGK